MYTEFNKSNVKNVREDINAKLAELKELGLNIELGNIRFDSSSLSAKIEVVIEGGMNADEKDFTSHYSMFNNDIKAEDLNTTKWLMNGEKVVIVGRKSRSKKYPLIIKYITSGKLVKCNEKWFNDNATRV